MINNKSYRANTIVEEVYEHLKSDILNLIIKPGQMITEQEVCEKYNISRTPSRDVISKLRSDDLVFAIPYKANYVSLLNFSNISQLIYMRIAIETMVIRDAIKIMNKKTLEELKYNLRQQEILLEDDFTPEEFYKLDSKFHKIWFGATDKLIVWEQIQKSQVHYTRFRMLDIVVAKDFIAIYEEHKKLLDIIEHKKIDEIEYLVTMHLNGGIRRLGDKIHSEFANYFVDEF